MNFLRKIDVRARLTLSFLVVIASLALAGILGVTSAKSELQGMSEEGKALTTTRLALKSWQTAIQLNLTRADILIASMDTTLMDQVAPAIKATTSEIDAGQAAVEALLSTDAMRSKMSAIKAVRKEYSDVRKEAFSLYSEGKQALAAQLWSQKAVPAAQKYRVELKELEDMLLSSDDERIAAAQAHAETTQNVLFAANVVVSVFSLVLAYLVSRSITQPLEQVQVALEALKQGDLTYTVSDKADDVPGRLVRSLQDTADALRATVSAVAQNASLVSASAQEIAQGTMDLSSRTEAQAASLEESASAIEEVTSNVQANAQTCVVANRKANDAVSVGAQAQTVVTQVSGTMGEIAKASQSITEVLSLIDSIAFQTNILALNAAVEAARAGEQGRGFAVVASEVRSLAARSAEAAKEIKGIVEATLSKVQQGTEQSATAGIVMAEVTEAMTAMRTYMDEIANSSREQALGLAEVSKAISVLDSGTQQNAALVEESSAAAKALTESAVRMETLTRSFKV